MTPLQVALLYFRLVIYPTLTIGFVLLSIFDHFPNERRMSTNLRAWLYRGLASVFAVFGLVVLARIVYGSIPSLTVVDYFSPLPLAFVTVLLGINLWLTGKRA